MGQKCTFPFLFFVLLILHFSVCLFKDIKMEYSAVVMVAHNGFDESMRWIYFFPSRDREAQWSHS